MIALFDDVEKMTRVKKHVLLKISNCIGLSLIDNLMESLHGAEGKEDFDIGIGTLTIDVYDDVVHYYFKPSPTLENGIVSAINDGTNPIEESLMASIDKHIYKTYKDML